MTNIMFYLFVIFKISMYICIIILKQTKTKIMKNLKTITGEEIRISSNKSKRTFTIITTGGKYRTYPTTKSEFEANEYNTGNDWKQFLKTDNYYKVK